MLLIDCYDVGISRVQLIKGNAMRMLSSTVQCSSVGTKCISLMTRFKQPRHLTSFSCASHAIVKLVSVDQLSCIYSARGTFMDAIYLLQLSLHPVSMIASIMFVSLQVL
jgi:hypothetical protein